MAYEGMLIDVHTHMFPDVKTRNIFRDGYFREYDDEDALDTSARRFMKSSGISKMNVLLFLGVGSLYYHRTKEYDRLIDPAQRAKVEEIRQEVVDCLIEFNDWGVDVVARDPEMSCFIGLDPVLMDPATMIRELEDKVRRGAKGVKLLPMDYVATLDDPRLDSMWDFCQSTATPVMHGPGRNCFYRPTGWKRFWGQPLELAGVYKRFPRVRTCQAHLHDVPFISELARQHAGVHADLSAILYNVGTAEGQIPPEKMAEDIRAVGVDRVLFGTNFGTISEATAIHEAEVFRNLPLSRGEFERIGSENYWSLLGGEGT